MILNSKNNQFVFKLPKGFLDQELQDKYSFYLKRLPTPFSSMEDYLNHTIQTINFPSVSSENVEQMLDKRPQYWRQSFDIERVIPKQFEVTFKTADGFLNYWVLFEQYKKFLNEQSIRDYFPDMQIIFLDREGYEINTITFRQPMMTGITGLDMSYASVGPEFSVFTVNFFYNNIEINVKLD